MACTIVFGKPGVGKTALLTYMSNEVAFDYERLRKSYAEIDGLNTGGFQFEKPNCLVFMDYSATFHKSGYRPKKSYEISGFHLGLPNNDYDTVLLPPYSFIVLDEAQKYYNSRLKNLNDYVSRFYELRRHNGYDIVLACQRLNLIDLNVREIADEFILVDDLKFKYDKQGNIKQMIWTCYVWDNLTAVTLYNNTSEKKYLGQKRVYKADYNVFNCYNSFNFKASFFKNCTVNSKFDLIRNESLGFDLESIAKFNEQFDYTVPKGYRS